MKLERAKGTRDIIPEEKIVRQEVIDSLRNIFERYGFSPLETPTIERFDVLAAKYAGGSEILKETFQMKDQGKRDLCLRYDLTVPFCRFIGMNPTIKMPFKRYQIGRVFRDGPIKTGRLREFWQCDVDVVGTKNMIADAEIIKITQRFFKSIELNVIIEVNNRKLLDGLMDDLKIPEGKREAVIIAIDKLKKVPIKDIEKELETKGIKKEKVDELFKILNTDGTNIQKLEKLRKLLKSEKAIEGLDEIENLLKYVNEKDKDAKVVFAISLARGLSYYTGTVFEAFMADGKFRSSLCGGGRYDNMIGNFLGGNREFPAVGISFGIEPISVMMTEKLKSEQKKDSGNENIKKTVTELYVIPIPFDQSSVKAAKIVEELREAGLKVDMDLSGKGISKNLNFANSYNIPYVLFVGEEELKKKKFKLKDMIKGKEEFLDVKGIVKKLK
ncbi:histidine--tRNA ligase [Candidatus Woesearchaeota archaeon]|jgi:histidyl-tRNA synthetase|nr:histidine--tRNA ligase [Candidatus Woesearchaeota archaeon]MBT5272022.1 histidine--tRNA ligase [Candidatus Woesearchaeota archaeon]MBT6040763.1 histidine--tRNA ligase [Candidatus Woesearchaeota archaeon]MBT6336715.1 histidine--tRNA ligase [Candidatus Woesearchaeota archaeon]